MDTPEADVSAIQSGIMQPLPTYEEHDSTESGVQPLVSAIHPSDTRHLPPTYGKEPLQSNEDIESENNLEDQISCHVHDNPLSEVDELVQARREIVDGFFDAIQKENPDAIALFINRKLVTANTTTEEGRTPLLAAVATKNIQIVQLLLDFGAEPDAFGVIDLTLHLASLQSQQFNECYTPTKRTPLQLAASLGHLPIVKLLHGTYHCSDSAVAPDGQIALRLASTYGHRDVVEYLPACRAGGFRRWKVQHEKAIERCTRALRKIYKFFKFFVWDVEKFLLWSCPKHILVMPLAKGCKWCWKHKEGIAKWCKAQVQETPGRVKKAGKWVWKGLKKLPGRVERAGKATWRFGTQELPKLSKQFGRWLIRLLFTRIPNAAMALAKWIWSGITAAAQATWNVILRLASLLHTVISAITTFFQELTWKDIWNGICDVFNAVFVGFPKQLWEWMKRFGEVSYRVLKVLFGTAGKVIWYCIAAVGCLIFFTIVYVPKQIWDMVASLGGSFAKASYEIRVWFSPKA